MIHSFHPRIFAEGQTFACLQRGIIFSGKRERMEQTFWERGEKMEQTFWERGEDGAEIA